MMNNNGINKDIIFKPQPWRWFFFHWPINTIALALGGPLAASLSGRHYSLELIPGIVIVSAVVHLLFSRYTDNWKVIISENEILGGWKKGKRIIIPFEDIDRTRSFQKTTAGKLFGFDYIYSKSGQKIYVESISLGREQVYQIKSTLKI
jgi:hypothetical protein